MDDEFDPELPIEEASTPPSSWYTDPSFLDLELDRVFYRGWQAVGSSSSLLLSTEFVLKDVNWLCSSGFCPTQFATMIFMTGRIEVLQFPD